MELFLRTLFGGVIRLSQVCRGYLFSKTDQQLSIDLIVMTNIEFVVIVGMNFQSVYHASIDCFKWQVIHFTPKGDYFQFKGDHLEFSTSSFSDLSNKELFYGILATLSTINGEAPVVKLPLMVCEFLIIFLKDLLGLPPTRVIEFSIDLVLGTLSISIPSCRMAHTELNELKV